MSIYNFSMLFDVNVFLNFPDREDVAFSATYSSSSVKLEVKSTEVANFPTICGRWIQNREGAFESKTRMRRVRE